MIDLYNHRKDYTKHTLLEKNLEKDPIDQFHLWYSEVEQALGTTSSNIMTLSTCSKENIPSARIVLLKKYSEEGFTFFTNYLSNKGQQITQNPKVCLNFFWEPLERQIIIIGNCKKVTERESDDYFSSRPYQSQLSAIASEQSQPISSREQLDEKVKRLEKKYLQTPPKRPNHWGGYLVKPSQIEFWQGRSNRLHDRILYKKTHTNNWEISRLCP